MKNQVWRDYIEHNYIKTTKIKDITFRIVYPTKLNAKKENEHRTQDDGYFGWQECGGRGMEWRKTMYRLSS